MRVRAAEVYDTVQGEFTRPKSCAGVATDVAGAGDRRPELAGELVQPLAEGGEFLRLDGQPAAMAPCRSKRSSHARSAAARSNPSMLRPGAAPRAAVAAEDQRRTVETWTTREATIPTTPTVPPESEVAFD